MDGDLINDFERAKLITLDQIINTNPLFIELFNLLKEEFEMLKKELESKKMDIPIMDFINTITTREVVVESGAYSQFQQKYENERICEILVQLIQIPAPLKKFEFSLDSRRYVLSFGDLYRSLFDTLFHHYLKDPQKLETLLLDALNDFINCFNTRLIPYEIIVPLKGIQLRRNSDEFILKYHSFQSGIILYNKFPKDESGLYIFQDEVIIKKDTCLIHAVSCHGNNTIDESIGVYGKSCITFDLFQDIQDNRSPFPKIYDVKSLNKISESVLWNDIKRLIISFIISNCRIAMGIPQYRFPWWIPKYIVMSFDFREPEWMIKNIHHSSPFLLKPRANHGLIQKSLVPDLDGFMNFCFDFTHMPKTVDMEHWCLSKTPCGFFGFGVDLDETQFNHCFADLNVIMSNYHKLNDQSHPINFIASDFLFSKLLRLRDRDTIEDAIVDANLILESLLLPRENKQDLRYRFRLNASFLLSSNKEELEKNYEYFGVLYDLRSAIVHGGKNYLKEYKKLVGIIKKSEISESGEELIKKTTMEVIDDLFLRILKIIHISIDRKMKIPEDFEKITNLIDLIPEQMLKSNP